MGVAKNTKVRKEVQNRKGYTKSSKFLFLPVFTGTADNFLIKLDSVLYVFTLLDCHRGGIFLLNSIGTYAKRGFPLHS